MTEEFSQIEMTDDRVRKVQLKLHPEKKNNIEQEAAIILQLNSMNCPCVPKLLDFGLTSDGYPYLELQRVEPAMHPARIEDIWLSYLTVRGLGFNHGDLLNRNAIFDGEICWLIDFDRAQPARATLRKEAPFCLVEESRMFQYSKLFESRFDLYTTTLATAGYSTIGCRGIYHDIDEEVIFMSGERCLLPERRTTFSKVNFSDEHVMDIGCNTGLMTRHIASSGARYVTGIEIVRPHALLGQHVNCILGVRNASIMHQDASEFIVPAYIDTVCVLSVLHHIKKMELFASRCRGAKRLLIECRLHEAGNHRWEFADWKSMRAFLEKIFCGFKFQRDYGPCDRNRHLLEFTRL